MPSDPDIVVIVLDCLRASSLAEGTARPGELPNLEALRRESIQFPRTASVSHWTVPSHASLLSGRYPWEHGLYRGGAATVSPESPLIARGLARAGYRTASFAANGLLNPTFGWLEGFDYAAWGSSAYLRSSRTGLPPHEWRVERGRPDRRAQLRDRWHALTYWAVVGLERFPWVLDRVARWEHAVRGDRSRPRPVLAPWIEPSFTRWVQGTPRDQPLFAFLNLMDAHEPYLIDREDGIGASTLAEAARVRQDHHGWITGRWEPTPRESELLELLYRASVRVLDERVGRLIASLRDAGRWDRTLLVLTSDHGQAFGGEAGLYHMTGLSEELLRVPLWVRLPNGEGAGRVARGWASPIDVPGTLAQRAGLDGGAGGSGVPLPTLLDREREGPVYALGDGPTFGESAEHLGGSGGPRLDPRALAAYQGRWKAVLRLDEPAPRFFDLDSDPSARHPVASTTPEARRLGEALAEVRRRLEPGNAPAPLAGEERLRAWGYLG